jgi:hypothetical protein
MTFDEWIDANGSICPVEARYAQLVWNAALEEAAKACEAKARQREIRFDLDGQEAAADCSEAVRALKA